MGTYKPSLSNIYMEKHFIFILDMDYLADNFWQLVYFGTILEPSSELSICHETSSRGTTASRRFLEDGGAPHPGWLYVSPPS